MWPRGNRCIRFQDKALLALIFAVVATGMGMAASSSALSSAPLAVSPGTAAWAVDPTVPGDDLPPVGRSLFDFLMTKKRAGQQEIVLPFPFMALMQHLENELTDGSDPQRRSLKAVLIPLGRSLQRTAAAPDFFASPRIVLTTDSEPALQSRLLLKDRLYLGYQAKADTIEVISYNEAAGRFEFQVVKDYRPGGTPKLYYANRALCMACHQNAGPIFSRQVWDETNANPRITALLKKEGKDFYGIKIERGIDIPNAIDNAKLRANRYAVSQLLWREGCDGNDALAKACRAQLFITVLQYRLSGEQQFERHGFVQKASRRIRNSWQARWPNGLAMGNPDIPNRDPLGEQAINISARFDPLVLREPLEIWTVPKNETLDENLMPLIAGLSQFIADNDVNALMNVLEHHNTQTPLVSFTADCDVVTKQIEPSASRLDLRCASQGQNGFGTTGQLQIKAHKMMGGKLDQLTLPGQAALRDIDLGGAPIIVRDGSHLVAVALSRNFSRDPGKPENRTVRAADGNAVTRMQLRWQGDDPSHATAEIILARDFAPVTDAITAIFKQGVQHAEWSQFDGFDALPFRRARLMPALFQQLGLSPKEACCLDTTGLPPAQKEPLLQSNTAQSMDAGARPFFTYCATCHQTADRAPPGFLQGDAATVNSNLNRCAERIYVRLSMWGQAADKRAKSPMPPEPSLHGLGIDVQHWPGSAERMAMTTYAGALLQAHSGRPPDLDALLAKGYEQLPACVTARRP